MVYLENIGDLPDTPRFQVQQKYTSNMVQRVIVHTCIYWKWK